MRGHVPALGHLRGQLGRGRRVGGAVDLVVDGRHPRPARRELEADETDGRVGAVGQDLVGEVGDVSVWRGPGSGGGHDPGVQVDRLTPVGNARARDCERRAAVGERERRPRRDVRPLLDVIGGLWVVRHLPVEAGQLRLGRNRSAGIALSGRGYTDAQHPVAGERGGIRPPGTVRGQHERAGPRRWRRLRGGHEQKRSDDRQKPDVPMHALPPRRPRSSPFPRDAA